MLFNSLEFFFFFIAVYGLYLISPFRWQNRLLIVASCLFYAAWNWKFLALMFVSITTDYFCAKYMDQTNDEKRRRLLLALSIGVNLTILGFFKYFNFFSSNLSALLATIFPTSHAALSKWTLNIILPVGISFYTFEAISYTFDVYRRIIKPAQRYWDYVIFVIYFPHLVAGPIMRAKDFLPQIIAPRVLSLEQFYEGCSLVFWGYFEKLFIADNLAKIVNPVFTAAPPYDGASVLIALYAFAFQIFCDFDAYSNIARGLGKCMGFEITINFKWPYFVTNPVDFWRRWHISLSSWLRDYLYIPLGGSRQSTLLTYRNLFITMFLGGLWHGASWTFVLWGVYHAILLISHRIITSRNASEPEPAQKNEQPWLTFLKTLFFFHLVVFGWLLFRAGSLTQVIAMLKGLCFHFHFNNEAQEMFLHFVGIMLPLLGIQLWQYYKKDLSVLFHQHWFVKTFLYALMTYLILGWGVLKAEEFIYFQF
ncbi:MAG: MBOAT family protein [Candidatus Omnitrophica bacterium]|nr:MBOAT family protein [Candidatus Omnitrophota bacterium]